MKNNVKIAIIVGIIVAVALAIVLVVMNVTEKKATPPVKTPQQVKEETPISTTRKMAKYIDIINGSYYMKYKSQSGENEEISELTTEYTTDGQRMALNYVEYLTQYLISEEGIYYIMHDTKVIISYPDEEDAKQYYTGLQRGYTQQFFEQNFKGTGTEDIENVAYYYEEYSDNTAENGRIRYYFDDNDQLKYIKSITKEGSAITTILELSDRVKESLFELPKDYKIYDVNELSANPDLMNSLYNN